MDKNYATETYRIWAHDNQVYGPVELPMLLEWVDEERILPETWVYLDEHREWRQARTIPPLQEQLSAHETSIMLHPHLPKAGVVSPEELRKFTVLSSLSNQQLLKLIRFGELYEVKPFEVVIKKGEPGDAMYFLLDGTVRARLVVGLQDKTLSRISPGEFFGEMAMFTQSPRSADVVAETNARLLRFSAESFHHLSKENPEAAAPMLFAITRTMANRIWEGNSRYQREVAAEFVWR